MGRFLTFEISDEKQKSSFSNISDWESNFKKLKCDLHQKNPRLNLSIDKKGSNVTVNTCCSEFFEQIVTRKFIPLAD